LKLKKPQILIGIFLLLTLISVSAQQKQFPIELLTTEEGLTQNHITYITQDIFGYTWIATQEGLNRYDGYDVKTFRYDPSDQNSPRGNWMHRVYTDSHGNIYIAQAVGGFDIYDQAADKFTALISNPNDSSTISSNFLPSAFFEDSKGNVWIGYVGQGLNRYTPESNSIKRYLPGYFNQNSISGFNITKVFQDKANDSTNVWVATSDRGLSRINIYTDKVERFGWRDLQYPKSIYDFIDSKLQEKSVVAEISEVKDSSNFSLNYNVEQKSHFLVISCGEAFEYGNFDYGYITNGKSVVWDFDQRKSLHAGGANKNRIIIDVVELDKGEYQLQYISDNSHSYNRWNETPPEREELWGIKIVELNSEEAERIQRVINDINTTGINPAQIYSGITSDSNGRLIFSSWGYGLIGYENLNGKFSSIYKSTKKDDPNNYLRSLGKIDDRYVWSINQNYEFVIIDLFEKQIVSLSEILIVGQTSQSFQIVDVDIYENIWVNLGSSGVVRISQNNGKFELLHFQRDVNDENSINSNSIQCVYSDNFGNTWIGTTRSGVNRINPGKVNFNIALNKLPLKNTGEYPAITSFVEDNSGVLYIGTAGGGIYKFDPESKTIKRFLNNTQIEYAHSLYITGNLLWIGTISSGLKLFDLNTGKFVDDLYGELKKEIEDQAVYFIFQDERNYYWIGTSSKGLYKFEPIENRITNYVPNADDSTSLPGISVWSIYQDSEGTLWIGTAVGGLSIYNYDTDNFKNYLYNPDDPKSLNNTSVTCIVEDNSGNFWLGTYSGGINLMNRATGEFKAITTKEGLPNNRIDGILVDKIGCLWISTNTGIARFDPSTKAVKKYSPTNGLQSYEFFRGAYHLGSNHTMYFGGAKGFNYFNPEIFNSESEPPKILLTEFREFNTPRRFDKSLNQIDEIEISYYDNHFSFEFLALDYTNPSKSEYMYKLEGFDNDWINSGSRRYASYTNLDPGNYIFEVKAANAEGVWNEEGRQISIVVLPPFWLTWWFFILLVLFIVSTLWIFHLKSLKTRVNRTLEHERIRNRERDLVREELARDFHDELGHKLTRITLFVRRLKKQLNGAAQKVILDLDNVAETSNDLRIGAKDLIWTLKPEEDTLYDLIIRLKDFGDDLFNATDVKFLEKGISEELKNYNLPMEWKRHLVLIFKEAMNNSLKYAMCSSVELIVEVTESELSIILKDDGVGFNISDKSEGYGISNIQTRAKKINGELKIVSELGEGTTVQFRANVSKPQRKEIE
jgi:ligand-binding sensor domain-containing protein/signal transduction histidine kinase